MLNQVTHANGIVDTQANDPDMMRRPSAISSARSGVTLWSSGTYKYDGSGNVVKTGNAYPANEVRPTASALALANNGILKLGSGALAFFNNQPSGSAHLIIDVTGYFTADAGAVVAYQA